MLNTALTIILDEHRSLAAVTHGLRFLVREMREKGIEPDGKLLWAMLYYIDTFPQKLHHPKEEAYLFRRLKMRTREADKAILEAGRAAPQPAPSTSRRWKWRWGATRPARPAAARPSWRRRKPSPTSSPCTWRWKRTS